jgi:predicted ArsR family transcriptional regulator
MESETSEQILSRNGMAEILTVLYLEKSTTCYRIAKKTGISYRTVGRRLKESETAGIICCQQTEIVRGRVNKIYSLTLNGKKIFVEWWKRRMELIFQEALNLGLDLRQILKKVENESKQ